MRITKYRLIIGALSFLVLLGTQAKAQSGAVCSSAYTGSVENAGGSTDYLLNPSSGTWIHFIATSSDLDIHVSKPTSPIDTLAAHIHTLELYVGVCTNLQLIGTESVSHGADTLPFLKASSLNVGDTYFLLIKGYNAPNCQKCVNLQSYFSLAIASAKKPEVAPTSSCEACGFNLIVNGDFESAPNPSTTPYQLYAPSSTDMDFVTSFAWTDEYSIGRSAVPPHNYDPLDAVDHTSGGGYFFWGDSRSDQTAGYFNDLTDVAWEQNVWVTNGQKYVFSLWIKDVGIYYSIHWTQFKIKIDGQDISGWFNNGSSKTWHQFCFEYTADETKNVKIEIINKGHKDEEGCDFGIDDISFRPVNFLNTISITSNSPGVNCAGQQVTLTANGGANYIWSTGETTSSIVVAPSVTTTYTVIGHSDVAGCEGIPATITVSVSAVQPSFTYTTGTCIGNIVSFTNLSLVNGLTPVTYFWDFGDGNIATGFNASHVYNSPGTYSVSLTSADACGQLVTATAFLHVIPSTSTYNPVCCSETQTYTFDQNLSGPIIAGGPLGNPVHWTPVNGTIYVRGTVNILPGNELIIDAGTVVEFDPLSKIVVSRGAVLTINGATLKGLSACGTMWQGIEVWGDKTKTEIQVQDPSTGQLCQGKVLLTGAIIGDAHNGVVAGQGGNNYYNPNFGGGIIVASATQFINCGYSIRFTPYPYVNHSRITSCSFNSTTLLDPGYNSSNSYTYPNINNQLYAYSNVGQRAYCFIQAIGVKFILIGDNIFDNAEYGIVGINSSLRVIDWDLDGTGNEFSNLTNGEVHGNIFNSPFYANRIERNEFTSTIIPIQSWNGMGDRIYKNDLSGGAFVGIGSVSSKAITINDNTIGGATNGCLVGISTSNTGSMGGLIGFTAQGNIFTRCVTGTATGGNNPFLQIHCNVYDNPVASQYNQNWNIGGTSLANQGIFPATTEKDPAGNFFIDYTPNRNQIASPLPFDYYSHNTTSFSSPSTVIPTAVGSPVVIPTGSNMTSFASACTPGPPCTNCNPQMALLDDEISLLEAEKAAIDATIDGGQTQVLLNAINSGMPGGQLKDLLLANSPLSDEILLAYIAISGTPPGLFKEVIIPNSPVSSVVRPSLNIKLTSLPSGIVNEIQTAQSSANRTLYVVNSELQSKIGQRQQFFNEQMTWYVDRSETDTLVEDSVYILLERQNTYAATSALASAYLAGEHYAEALTTINTMGPVTPEEQAEKDMLVLLHGIYSSGREVFLMTTAEEQQVRNIAALPQDCPARANARVILFIVFGEPLIIDLNSNARIASSDTTETGSVNFLGECYPNPAIQQVNMECQVPAGSLAALRVFDVNGKLVYSQIVTSDIHLITIQTSEWSSGVYFGVLETETEIIGKQKIVVSNPE